jgi:flagellum-specific peptidoglycan hydrolase FlgJ
MSWEDGRIYKNGKNWLNKYQGKDFNKKKTKINIDATHVFTVCFLLIGLFAFVSDTHAVEIKTNSKPLFVYSLNSCITDLNKTTPIEKQIPSELIVAQAIIETGWGTSRFANEANNLFGIREGLKEFKTKCDSVADYIRIINEVPVYAEFREMRQDGVTDALLLARTLKKWAADPKYTDLIEDVIQYNIRGVYEL